MFPIQKNRSARPTGFTLVELLVVIAIIAVLSMIGLTSFSSAARSGRDSKRKADLSQARAALELYRTEFSAYPTGTFSAMTGTLVTAGYLTQPVPVDPKNVSPYQYAYSRPSASTFCICAQLENTGTGNAANSSCSFGTGNFYCMTQP